MNATAADHGSDVDIIVVRDAEAVMESGLQVVCTDDTVEWFTKAMVSRATAAKITVVGVRSSPESDARLAAMGIAHRINDAVAPTAMLEMLARLRPRDTFDDIVAHLEQPVASCSGRRYVVGGPPGAGGRESRHRACRAARPSRLDGAGGLQRIIARCCSTSRSEAATAHPQRRRAGRRRPGADGGTRASRPTRCPIGCPSTRSSGCRCRRSGHGCPRSGVDVLLAACQSGWAHTVVVTSPVVEDLRRWVDRYGLSRDLIANGGTVIGVCEASPRGVLRFADWLADCQPTSTVWTVVNKVPGSRFAISELTEQLRSLCGDRIDVVATVPVDRRVTAAEWDAVLPSAGGFTRALRDVAGRLAGVHRAPPAVVGGGPDMTGPTSFRDLLDDRSHRRDRRPQRRNDRRRSPWSPVRASARTSTSAASCRACCVVSPPPQRLRRST